MHSIITPPLTHNLHKGQCGRIAVVGGSQEYTGAPYFAAISALRVGSDLAHVFCSPLAATAIKSYSPELIVHPYLDPSQPDSLDKITSILCSRIHTLVVGPGLGRNPDTLHLVAQIITNARNCGLGLVLDADALYLIQLQPQLITGYRNAILTPNKIEFQRLCTSMGVSMDSNNGTEDDRLGDVVKQLANKLGNVTMLAKGQQDIITDGHDVLIGDTPGSPRRCGGQGDVLSGALSTFLSWANQLTSTPTPEHYTTTSSSSSSSLSKNPILLACLASSTLVRKASLMTYEKYGRSMLTTDMIPLIGAAFERVGSSKEL